MKQTNGEINLWISMEFPWFNAQYLNQAKRQSYLSSQQQYLTFDIHGVNESASFFLDVGSQFTNTNSTYIRLLKIRMYGKKRVQIQCRVISRHLIAFRAK